mmetsp:Transcript_65736/g.106563  ORF Transcript_65736/g.106563 Transcript_65736/m.106563 type:complete len:106 (+) Transcript_65736:322-639(+)
MQLLRLRGLPLLPAGHARTRHLPASAHTQADSPLGAKVARVRAQSLPASQGQVRHEGSAPGKGNALRSGARQDTLAGLSLLDITAATHMCDMTPTYVWRDSYMCV